MKTREVTLSDGRTITVMEPENAEDWRTIEILKSAEPDKVQLGDEKLSKRPRRAS